MKKILFGFLFLISAACADNLDAPELFADDWYFVDEPAAIPHNMNRPGVVAPDPYKQPSWGYRAWEGTKSGADWAFSEPLENVGNKASDGINKALDDKVFNPWEEYNRGLEAYVEERKRNLEKEILGLLWYYTVGK